MKLIQRKTNSLNFYSAKLQRLTTLPGISIFSKGGALILHVTKSEQKMEWKVAKKNKIKRDSSDPSLFQTNLQISLGKLIQLEFKAFKQK